MCVFVHGWCCFGLSTFSVWPWTDAYNPGEPGGGRRAAALAAYYSSARDEAAVDIDVCRRTGVRRIKGGPPGLVSYHAESTIRVAPDQTGSATA
jgi:hypothetical protein